MSFLIADLLTEVETLPDEWALVLLDRALAAGRCSARELVAEARSRPERTQWLVVIADARATTTAHSLIRRAWYGANLPTPSIGRMLKTPAGPVRTACATEYHRFAVTTHATTEQGIWLERVSWRLLVVPEQKVLGASSADLAEHLRAEHLHHLSTIGLGLRRSRQRA